MASKVIEGQAQRAQAKALKQAASTQQELAERHAAAVVDTAMENARRETRNAQQELAHARADAAASSTLREGSTALRETDLATRLQDRINNQAEAALQQANAERTRPGGGGDSR